MRLLFLGDVVGRSGRGVVVEHLPKLIKAWRLDFVAVNGENAAGGFGITEPIYNELIDVGADAITLGNHAWDQREAMVFIERAPHLIRPLNYPSGTPGRGAVVAPAKNGARVLVINLMGRVFMDAMDDPFAVVDREITAIPLAVFDRRGHRIGYGAGYYDMTIASARARKPITTIGLAFAVQEAPNVPILPHDERLDLVLTEKELIDCRGA